MIRAAAFLVLASASSVLTAAESSSLAVPLTPAPPLGRVEPGRETLLGHCDDVGVCAQADVLLLRCAGELYSVSLEGDPVKTLVIADPRLANAHFVVATEVKERRWVFLARRRAEHLSVHRGATSGERIELTRTGPGGAPLAVELTTKRLLEFVPAGVAMREDQELAVNAAAEHGGAIVTIGGADPSNWPDKPTLSSVRFWLDLATGRTAQLPIGWSPTYYSADLRWAGSPENDGWPVGRVVKGLNLATGQIADSDVPDWHKDYWVLGLNRRGPLSSEAEPLYKPKPLNTRTVLAGIAAGGKSVPWDFAMEDPYLPTAKASDGWAALHVRGHDAHRKETHSLWFAPLQQGARPRRLADGVGAYELLGPGQCLFTAMRPDPLRDFYHASFDAYLYEDRKKAAWDVLDRIDRLPPLAAELTGKPYVEDKMSIRLLRSFGCPARGALVLASFDHLRSDLRAMPFGHREPPVPRARWKSKVLLASDGRRLELDLPDRESEQLWLHNSATLVRAVPKTLEAASGAVRRLEVSLLALRRAQSEGSRKALRSQDGAAEKTGLSEPAANR